jgi:hypothetical protein
MMSRRKYEKDGKDIKEITRECHGKRRVPEELEKRKKKGAKPKDKKKTVRRLNIQCQVSGYSDTDKKNLFFAVSPVY